MIAFAQPWALALILPAFALWWWAGRGRLGWWRFTLLALLVVAAAGPRLTIGRGGSDVVLVLDRSTSMGEARNAGDEQLRLAGAQRGERDRLAVVAVGAGVQVGQGPELLALPRLSDLAPGEDGSDLAAGLEAALALIPPGRSSRVLLISDGEATGRSPAAAASRLAAAGVPVDVLPVERPSLPDAAILAVEIPGSVRLGESFVGAVRLIGEARERRPWRVFRDQIEIAKGEADLRPGDATVVTFADRPTKAGVAAYRVELGADNDREPRNNRARAVLRVAGAERVLVLAKGGNVAAALRATGLAVDHRAPGRIGLEDLLGCDALVLDDVPADVIGPAGLRAIAQWVERLGGGLLMLGGRQAGGNGGWHKSEVERILPVTFELKDEHRRFTVAMAIAMDRSGSMSAPAGGGRQKMDLANEGACAAIALLSPRDKVALFAVDTSVHTVIPFTAVENPSALANQARGIQSQGGGIFIQESLEACAAVLAKVSGVGVRHAVIFADAADSRQHPGNYEELADHMRQAGITVSVIGMGTDHDSDADILTRCAEKGGGRVVFAIEPDDIPRLFAQETMVVARSSWVDQRVRLQAQNGVATVLGPAAIPAGAWPEVPGCNLSWPRPRAQVLALAPADPTVPAVAAWRCGAGRSAWIGLDCDDEAAPELRAWPGYSPLLAGLARWCAGAGDRLPGALTAHRTGRTVEVRLECDPAERARWADAAPRLAVAGVAAANDLPLDPADDGVWTGRFELDGDQTAIPAVSLGTSSLIGPALCLPYSPEATPRLGLPSGRSELEAITRAAQGRIRSDLAGLFANPPSPGGTRDLTWPIVLIVLILAVVEIAWRRLALEFGLVAPIAAKSLQKAGQVLRRTTQPDTLIRPPAGPTPLPPGPSITPTPVLPPTTPATPATPNLGDAFEQMHSVASSRGVNVPHPAR